MNTDDHPLIAWLLESQIPSIRYITLTHLLEISSDHPKVQAAFQHIQTDGPVPAILNRQITAGQWPYLNHYYTPKYVSTHWSLLLLEELRIDSELSRFQDGVEYMLSVTANAIDEQQKQPHADLQCLWSNIIRYAIHAGRLGDERLTAMIQLCADSLIKTRSECKYNGDLPCAWGANRILWAFAAIPLDQRSAQVEESIQKGIQFLLEDYDLQQANYPAWEDRVHPVWFKLSFPLFYQSDILMTLRIMTEMNNISHPRVQPVLDWLESKRAKNGRWRGSSPYRQRTWPELADKEETNRWVSLYAAWILKKAGRTY